MSVKVTEERTISLALAGEVFRITFEEARELYRELGKIDGIKKLEWIPPQPQPPWWPSPKVTHKDLV